MIRILTSRCENSLHVILKSVTWLKLSEPVELKMEIETIIPKEGGNYTIHEGSLYPRGKGVGQSIGPLGVMGITL